MDRAGIDMGFDGFICDRFRLIINYMRSKAIGILDETSPDTLKRTGGTAPHWHIGKDKIALTNFKTLFGKNGTKIPSYSRGYKVGDKYTPGMKLSPGDYVDGYGVIRFPNTF